MINPGDINAGELLTVLENLPAIAILLDEKGWVRFGNSAFAGSTGRYRDGFEGRCGGEALQCVNAIGKPDNSGFVLKCHECAVRTAVMNTINNGEKVSRVEALIYVDRGNGAEELSGLISTSTLSVAGENIVLLCVDDITERRQVEDALRRSEERYALAQQSADIGSWDWEIPSGKLEWSERIEPIFGLPRGGFPGTYQAFLERIHPDDLAYVQESVDAALNEDVEYDIDHRIIWPDGTIRWVSETGRVFRDERGNPVRMLGIVQDITEKKQIDQLKDEFIGLVSHELRNPLTVIIGAINTVLEEGEFLSPEDTNQLLADASLEADSLSHLIGNLLELSRIRSRRFILYPEPINIQELIEKVIAKIKRKWPLREVEVNISGNVGSVRADPLRVERVLYNLVENAIKYSPEGSQIRISASLKKSSVVIGVENQGDGISLEDQAILFEPFERLQKHRSDGITGSGVGLSVCQRLVEAHGGYIWVESSPGRGSTFYFTLPQR
ncbi:MAG: ATP-binding protein [Dehalococcoidia bacterium]